MYKACLQCTPPIHLRLNGIIVPSKRCRMKIGLNGRIPPHTHLGSAQLSEWPGVTIRQKFLLRANEIRLKVNRVRSLCSLQHEAKSRKRSKNVRNGFKNHRQKSPITLKATNYIRQTHNNNIICIELCNILGDVPSVCARGEGAPVVD